MNLVELALRQKALLDEGAAILKANRAKLSDPTCKAFINTGEKRGDPAYGFAQVTNPKPTAVIVDHNELDRFLMAEGKFTAEDVIDDYPEAVRVLREHAPHVLRRVERVPEWARSEAQARAKAGEGIPGVQVRDSAPQLRLLPSDAVKAWAVEAMTTGLPGVES